MSLFAFVSKNSVLPGFMETPHLPKRKNKHINIFDKNIENQKHHKQTALLYTKKEGHENVICLIQMDEEKNDLQIIHNLVI